MLATVTGAVQVDPPFVELKDEIPEDSYGTITVPLGCTQGRPADTARMIRRPLRRSPGLPAIARCAHQNLAAARVVPLHVAITEEWTRGRAVAHNPVLV